MHSILRQAAARRDRIKHEIEVLEGFIAQGEQILRSEADNPAGKALETHTPKDFRPYLVS